MSTTNICGASVGFRAAPSLRYEHERGPGSVRLSALVHASSAGEHSGAGCLYSPRIRDKLEDRGCQLLYLPPYSPDLNPKEEAFSKVKRLLRMIGARTKEALVEAIGK